MVPTTVRRSRLRGFSLVELMIAVAIIGVLAALAIYGITLYLRSSKTAEAKNAVGAISRAALGSYEREIAKGETVKEGDGSSQSSHQLCGSALPVPATVPKGRKYQPNSAAGQDYESGDELTGWKCLMFAMTQPSYYQYGYARDAAPFGPNNPSKCTAECFEAAARGDLDGDGTIAVFAATGQINPTSRQLRTTSQLYVENEQE